MGVIDYTNNPRRLNEIIQFLEDDTQVEALPARVRASVITFTETAGAGTYTGTIEIPVGGMIHEVWWETTAAWDAITTLLDAGFTGSLTTYFNDANVDAVGANEAGLNVVAPDLFDSGTTFTAAITTTGTGGTTGRSRVVVLWSVPTQTAATKA